MLYYEVNNQICFKDGRVVPSNHQFNIGDRLLLEEMPFDHWTGTQFIHATGEAIFGELGWGAEYEEEGV